MTYSVPVEGFLGQDDTTETSEIKNVIKQDTPRIRYTVTQTRQDLPKTNEILSNNFFGLFGLSLLLITILIRVKRTSDRRKEKIY